MKIESRYFLLLPIIAVLPAFLGGATDRWSEGIVLIALGLLIAIRPPHWSPGARFDVAFFGILSLSTAAFLPAKWFGIPLWRTVATADYGLKLGALITPQPLLTLESIVLLAAGMAWFYYCVTIHASRFRRSSLAKIFCAGVTVLAGISIGFYAAKSRWPFWNASTVFGPFPNRNQMGDLLAIGTTLTIACAHDDFRNGKKSWAFWAGGAAVLFVSLVLAYSRAAIVLFFVALILWVACIASIRASSSRLAVGAGGILILWSAFLFGGGETLHRFLPHNMNVPDFRHDMRWTIQRDAWQLARTSPFTGIGLGNFESQFWMFHRALGTGNFHIIHPESDWLWAAIEMGWPAILLLLFACGLLAPRILPLGKDRGWRLRAAAIACAVIFAAHGFVDVSAHRLGSAFAALFVVTLGIGPWQRLVATPLWHKRLFRGAGIAFCVTGAVWLIASYQNVILPGALGVERSKEQISELNGAGDYTRASELATSALAWAPMDWELYYSRAVAKAFGTSDFTAALADFSRARYLNPITVDLPFNEGAIWLKRQPAFTLPAWQDALKRAGDSRRDLFKRMLDSCDLPWLRASLKEQAVGDSGLILVFLGEANPLEFTEEVTSLLQQDPEFSQFSPQEKQTLFRLWEQKGDKSDLAARAKNRESWLQAGWPSIAACHAAIGQYQEAYQMVVRYTPPPALPSQPEYEAQNQLEADLGLNPRDFVKGYSLYAEQIRAGAKQEALATLETLTSLDQCPSYFFSLKAALYADLERWQEAWEASKLSGVPQTPK